MYPTRNSLATAARSTMIGLLGARLADAIVLRTYAKVAHWNVKGRQFHSLHELFDAIAAEVDHHVDLIAERVVQLGGVAEGTAHQAASTSRLAEYTAAGAAEDHLAALADALADFAQSTRNGIDDVVEVSDHATADILTEIVRSIDKLLWMVESHLESEERTEWARDRSGSLVGPPP
jgi:starvation-inducible DNA-binding protein